MDPTSPQHHQPSSLPSKYQKLATEYAKLRSSASVLKRGLLEEQAKSAGLSDDLLSRDQTIRKKEQEIDSLSFRNTQLEKRVGVLQTELAVAKASCGSSRGGGLFHKSGGAGTGDTTTAPAPAHLNSELITKIEENIHLQRRLAELEELSASTLESLRAEFEAKENGRLLELESQLNALHLDNLQLGSSLQNALDEIEAYREQVGQLQGKIVELNSGGSTGTGTATTTAGDAGEIKKTNGNGRESRSSSGDFIIDDENEESAGAPAPEPPLVNPPIVQKLKSLEMEKEQWILEYHLLEVRLKKVIGKLEETTKILKSLGYEDHHDPISSPIESNHHFESTTIVGSIESTNPLELDPISSSIRTYLMSRIHSLICLLQDSDSRALTFYDEVKNLEKLLGHANDRRLSIEQELKVFRDKVQRLESDLEVVKDNYEGQLVAMSEHIVELNERIMLGGAGSMGKRK